jgi:hypothetical protein
VGVACRLRQYLARTSLWHDESFVVLNVLHRPFSGLLGHLEWNEPSPPGFLALEKMISICVGTGELALRLAPLVAGLLAFAVFARFARRSERSTAVALWAVALMALSGKLITHASEVKHFTFDLLAAVTLTAIAWRAWQTPTPRRALLTWGGVAAVALWFSYASVFVFGGTSLLLLQQARSWGRAERRAYAGANIVVLASLAALSIPIRQQRSGIVLAFWANALPDTSGALALLAWLARTHLGLFDHFWQPFGGAVLLLAAGGATALWRAGQRPFLALLWLPVMLALAASAAHLWPFGGNQHMCFAAPAIFLLTAEGAEAVRARLEGWRPRAGAVLIAALLSPGIIGASYHLIVPRYRHELRPIIAFVQERAQASDALIVFDPATFAYYAGRDPRMTEASPAPSARVWVITPQSRRGRLHPDVQRTLEDLRRRRPQLDTRTAAGAAGYLFDPASFETPPLRGGSSG